MKTRRIVALTLVISMAFALLGGCGKRSPSNTPGSGSGTSQTSASENLPPKTLKMVVSSNLDKLDPAYQGSIIGKIMSNLWFDTLVIYDESILDYRPWLCESYEHSEDGLVWTFHLRDGIKFSNGEALNADDVVYTFQRLLDDREGSPIAIQYWKQLKRVEKVDDLTVELYTTAPIANIRIGLCKTYIIPNEEHAKRGDAMFNEQEIPASGPWILDQWVDGQMVSVTKNPDYWAKDWFDSYYDKMEIRIVSEQSTAVTSHVSGDVQAYVPVSGISSDLIPLYDGTEDKILTYHFASGNFVFCAFSFREGSPFRDQNTRFAVEYAIDRQGIVDHILGGGEVPNSECLSMYIGYNPDLEPYVYDPEVAKEYLAKSSYDGREIEILVDTSYSHSTDIALYVSECLNKVGFNTHMRSVEYADLASIRQRGEYDFYVMNNMNTGGDIGNDMMQRFVDDVHNSYYSGPGYEELCKPIIAQATELDKEKRADLIAQAQAIVRKYAAPHTYLCQFDTWYAVDYGVCGLETFADGTYRFTFATYKPGATKNEFPDFSAFGM